MSPAEDKKPVVSSYQLLRAASLLLMSLLLAGNSSAASLAETNLGLLQSSSAADDMASRNVASIRTLSIHKRSLPDSADIASPESGESVNNLQLRQTRNFMRFGRRSPENVVACFPISDQKLLLQQLRPLLAASQHRVLGSLVAYDNRKRFMRFGKRFMRFGRSDGTEVRGPGGQLIYVVNANDMDDDSLDYYLDGTDSTKRFMRFGKRFMRFGRQQPTSSQPAGQVNDDETIVGSESSASSSHQKPVEVICLVEKEETPGSKTADKRFMRFGKRSESVDEELIKTGHELPVLDA